MRRRTDPSARRDPSKKRDIRQLVNLNQEEWAILERAAAKTGISISAYLSIAGLEKAKIEKVAKNLH